MNPGKPRKFRQRWTILSMFRGRLFDDHLLAMQSRVRARFSFGENHRFFGRNSRRSVIKMYIVHWCKYIYPCCSITGTSSLEPHRFNSVLCSLSVVRYLGFYHRLSWTFCYWVFSTTFCGSKRHSECSVQYSAIVRNDILSVQNDILSLSVPYNIL